ncbi:MAG: tetratricopeptide repeat protein [Bacteroidales bacterium]|nr:tetratricopeptide repeat protein [Bacteroidales bacterium]
MSRIESGFSAWIVILFFMLNISLCCLSQQITEVDSLMIEFTKANTDSQRIQIMMDAAYYYDPVELKKTIKYYNTALQMAVDSKKTDLESIILIRLAKIYHNSNLEIAQEYLVKAYAIEQILGRPKILANIYTQFGIIKMNLNLFADALPYYNKALRLYQNLNDSIGIAANLHNIGIVHFNSENLDSSFYYVNQALLINEKLDYAEFITRNYKVLSDLEFKRDSISRGLYFFDRSLEIAEKNKMFNLLQSLYNWKSSYYLNNQDYDTAIFYAIKTLRLQKKIATSYAPKDSYDYLRKSYAKSGNFDSAYHYSTLLMDFNDAISQFQNSQKIDLLELKLQFDHEEKMKGLKYRNKLLRMWMILSAMILLLFVSFSVVYILNVRNKKRQLESEKIKERRDELEHQLNVKSRELTAKVMHLIHVNNFIDSLIVRFSDHEDSFIHEHEEYFEQMIRDLKLQRDRNVWGNFEKEFTQVHPDFIRVLNLKHSNLTAKDKRLCTLIRMNLSSKEISNILNMEVRSVEMARTRLRKKLELTGSDLNLNIYLTHLVNKQSPL